MKMTHLSVRSGYSFFQSMIQLKPYIAYANQLDVKTLVLTDENVLHGAIPFYKECMKHHIKPIIGMIVNIEDDQPYTLLAKNKTGYQHLLAISTKIQQTNALSREDKEKYASDLICIIHSENTFVREMIIHKHENDYITSMENIYGKENVYLQVSRYKGEDGTFVEQCKAFAHRTDAQFVAMQDVRYLHPSDETTYATLESMGKGQVHTVHQEQNKATEKYFYDRDDMQTLFAGFPESLQTINEIVEQCQLTLSFEHLLLPAFPVPKGMSAPQYLKEVCQRNVRKRYRKITKSIEDRMNEELDIIISLGFADYFLIVADYVQFAKDAQIAVGPGRGSAAGSIVSYILGITNVDPLQYHLLFERFLNPERVTMPDIDMDFSDRRREEVIQYVREKYGDDYVAQIITFDTYGARSIIRELMKTLDVHEQDQSYILQQLKKYTDGPIATFINEHPSFKDYIKQSASLRTLFTHAVKLEGLPRHHSIHAAGIVLGKDPLIENVPLMTSSHEMNITQYPMNDLEAIGLLKMDILGLRNLSIMEQIIQSIERTTGKTIVLEEINEADEKTFALLRAGKTNGVFQFESDGMKGVLTKLKPNNFNDLVAINALYRPGPMQHIDTFIARKHGEQFQYIDEAVVPILKETYGVLVYQEQIMQIAHIVAGFSLGQADVLRRAVSKKQRNLMMEQERIFIDGAIRNGYSEAIAKEIYSWIVQFADYGFPKSHAVAYSKIAYQLSFLKANYPTYFFPPLLTSVMQDGKKVVQYIKEAKQLGLHIYPVCVNTSYGMFTAEKGNIRIGLQVVKGVGYDAVKQIIKARKDGKFTDLYDFCMRTNIRRKVLENLILAGAFDTLHHNRASLLASIDQVMAQIQLFGEQSIFNKRLTMTRDYVEVEDFTTVEKLRDEKELMQMYVSSHPMEAYRNVLARRKFITAQQITKRPVNDHVSIAGLLEEIRKIQTKRGESMAFITVQDETETVDIVLFPKVFRKVHSLLQAESLVQVFGKISERNGEKQMIADRLEPLPVEELGESKETLFIRMKERSADETWQFFQKQAKRYPGNVRVVIHNPTTKETFQMQEDYALAISDELLKTCVQYFGVKNVVIK